ncbi:MAG: type III pantothenate kinase [Gammaproteobacteria bacterium]|nr:type III pantothenate kinase [Gammaproteobacteria bacterium]
MKSETVLSIDIGNSCMKWAVCNLSQLSLHNEGVLDLADVSVEQLDLAFNELMVQPVWLSCVASMDRARLLMAWFREYWQLSVHLIERCPKRYARLNVYQQPDKLGIDRSLAMIAGQRIAAGNFCIIDAGTAITLDVVVDGMHKGGLIMPGRQLMLNSLVKKAENIKSASGRKVSLADNTADAIESGVLDSIVGGVDRALMRINGLYPDTQLIITGGDAKLISELSGFDLMLENNMVLKGVGVLAQDAYA